MKGVQIKEFNEDFVKETINEVLEDCKEKFFKIKGFFNLSYNFSFREENKDGYLYFLRQYSNFDLYRYGEKTSFNKLLHNIKKLFRPSEKNTKRKYYLFKNPKISKPYYPVIKFKSKAPEINFVYENSQVIPFLIEIEEDNNFKQFLNETDSEQYFYIPVFSHVEIEYPNYVKELYIRKVLYGFLLELNEVF